MTGMIAFTTAARLGVGPRSGARTTILAVAILVTCVACLPADTRGSREPASAAPDASPTAALPAGPTLRPTIVPPTPTPAPTFLVYTVVRGDSLNTIAHRFGTTARSIAFWNRETYPSLDPEGDAYKPGLLQVGWTLFLLPNEVVDEQELPDPTVLPGSDEPAPSA